MAGQTFAELSARHGRRYRWLLMATLMIGTMASIMSSTVVNVAIPDMSHHFALSQERAQWVSSGFMVAMTVSMLTTPWLLERFGMRATYSGCMVLLLAGGLAGGVAGSYPLVLAARVAEGLAAGVVQPIPAIVMLRAFQGEEQGRASSVFGMGVVLAPALGPSIGGVLVDGFGWRSIFFMVVPFCVLALLLARRYVPTRAEPPAGSAAPPRATLDWRGLLLGTGGTLCLLNGLLTLRGGHPAQAWGLLGVAALAMAAFVWWQRRCQGTGRPPLMDLRLFGVRSFAMGSIVAAIYGTALFGSTYLLPVYMQMGLNLAASHAATILLPAGIVLAITIGIVGRWSARLPTRWLVGAGLAMLAASFALVPLISPATGLWVLVALAVLGRIGLGFILPSLNLGAMRPLPRELIAQGSSAINFLRMLGGAAGVSLCALVLEWRLAAHGQSLAPTTAIEPARLAAFNETFLMLAALCALALAAAWQLREPALEAPDESLPKR